MRAKIGLGLLILLWATMLSVLGLWKYAIYRADVDDGIFTQVLLSFGSGFSSTVEGNINHLLVHCSPILVLLVPLVRWIGDARALIVAQACLTALVALPIYGIARRHTSEGRSLLIAAVALLYPVLSAAAFTDFHENAFVPFLSASLVWAFDGRRYRTAALAILALLCTKEDQFVLLGLIGLIVAVAWRTDRERVRFGLLMTSSAALAAIAYFLVLRPAFHLNVDYWSLHFYNWSYAGVSPLGMAPLTSPLRPLYLLWAFLPLAFVPLRSRYALLTIPGFIETLASHETIAINLGTHYTAAWLGYLLAAFAESAPRTPRTMGAAAALCAFTLLFHDPMQRWYFLYRLPNAHDARLDATLAALPAGATIGAEDPIFAHLANRRGASLGPNGQTYFVYDRSDSSTQWRAVDQPKVRALLRDHTDRVTSEHDGIVVLIHR